MPGVQFCNSTRANRAKCFQDQRHQLELQNCRIAAPANWKLLLYCLYRPAFPRSVTHWSLGIGMATTKLILQSGEPRKVSGSFHCQLLTMVHIFSRIGVKTETARFRTKHSILRGRLSYPQRRRYEIRFSNQSAIPSIYPRTYFFNRGASTL